MRLAPETDKTQSHEKAHFSGANPAVRVHALLGGIFYMKLPFVKRLVRVMENRDEI
jgi:hypothetical protein